MPIIAKARSNELKAVAFKEDSEHRLTEASFNAREFIEKPWLPSDAYYFPLDVDARGYAPLASVKTINPVHTTNIVFDESGAWVGTASTNLWPVKTANQGWAGTSTTNSVVAFAGNLKQELTKGGTAVTHNTLATDNSLAITTGSSYTVSSYYRQLSGTALDFSEFSLVKTTAGQAIANSTIRRIIPLIKEQWQRGIGSATYNESVTAWPYILWPSSTSKIARVCGHMLEAKPFVSAYTANTRGAGLLTFNLNATVALSWAANYTIIYWKKAHGNGGDTIGNTGFSLDSIGRNTNTVGGGYRWWGKANTSLAYGLGGTGTTLPSYESYQYEWYMHVIRRIGNTITLRVYSPAGLILAQDSSETTTAANRYVTQDGRDLQLGGYDQGTPCNTYYKDLIVIPGRGMSDAEIDFMFNAKVRFFTNSVYTPSMVEGSI